MNTLYEAREKEKARLQREWLTALVAAGRLTPEFFAAAGWAGSPGYMGTGTFAGDREPGYRS